MGLDTLDAALELLARLGDELEEPAMVDFGSLHDDDSPALALGVGGPRVPVTYQATLDPPYYISDGGNDAEPPAWFVYGQEPTQYPGRNLVPFDAAVKALAEFYRRPWLPKALRWERL